MLENLYTNPLFYVVAAVLLGLGKFAIERAVKSAVDHRFATRLEDHKHDLEIASEAVRFDFQRRLAGSGLYLERQHTAAAGIYAAVRVAHGEVSRLFGAYRSMSLASCDQEDLQELFERFEILSGKRQELLAIWKGDRKKGEEAIHRHLFELGPARAEAKLEAAGNQMYLNEIYFSDQTIQAFDGFVAECNKWILRRQFPPQRGEKVKMVDRDDLNSALDRVQTALRAELIDPPPLKRKESQRRIQNDREPEGSPDSGGNGS